MKKKIHRNICKQWESIALLKLQTKNKSDYDSCIALDVFLKSQTSLFGKYVGKLPDTVNTRKLITNEMKINEI